MKFFLSLLRKIKDDAIAGREMSAACLCDEVSARAGHALRPHLYAAFETWPKFTGSLAYPIDFHPVAGLARPSDAVYNYKFGWNQPLRIELLDHCIAYFEEKVS